MAENKWATGLITPVSGGYPLNLRTPRCNRHHQDDITVLSLGLPIYKTSFATGILSGESRSKGYLIQHSLIWPNYNISPT